MIFLSNKREILKAIINWSQISIISLMDILWISACSHNRISITPCLLLVRRMLKRIQIEVIIIRTLRVMYSISESILITCHYNRIVIRSKILNNNEITLVRRIWLRVLCPSKYHLTYKIQILHPNQIKVKSLWWIINWKE